uniref:Uncharacterized protein n=1 Tax=Lepeophtheirus salmonis TaxID=72036 RepID=A0A0K2U2Q7_LEPSM
MKRQYLCKQLFCSKNAETYLVGLQRLKNHLEKCIELQGDYIKNKNSEKIIVSLLGRKHSR